MALSEGDQLPNIELATPSGGRIALRSFAGRPLVLYFYPKDDTSGLHPRGAGFQPAVSGISAMPARRFWECPRTRPRKHLKFIDKYDLTVPLASDVDDAATTAFGTWIEKQLYGKDVHGHRPFDLPVRRERQAGPVVAQGARAGPCHRGAGGGEGAGLTRRYLSAGASRSSLATGMTSSAG